MLPFEFVRAETERGALQAIAETGPAAADARPPNYLAGGTTLLDLMKIEVMTPPRIVDINALSDGPYRRIAKDQRGLRLGALVRMSEAAEHADVATDYPLLSQSLKLAASQQLRNMASLAGNVLQRTRCNYFRDVSYAQCNKRAPGSGCAALEGVNRSHAVLGASEQCIATYPGDFAQALIALDARVALAGPEGAREMAFSDLHRRPGQTPNIETTLKPGELITEFVVPASAAARRSVYLKIRDRQSYEFALASAAVALDLDDGRIRDARIALGGVATVPWRAHEAEKALQGKQPNQQAFKAAADAAFVTAKPYQHNAFKIELGKRTLVRALQDASTLHI